MRGDALGRRRKSFSCSEPKEEAPPLMSIEPSRIPAPPAENGPVNAVCESAETLQLLARRRSTKIAALGAPGPSSEEIDALITLAARTPDHGKLAPWRFVVIDGESRARAGEALANVVATEAPEDTARIEITRGHFMRAPVCVMVVSTAQPHAKIPEWEQVLSAGAACYGLLIAAHAMGYAGAWLSEWPVYDAKARTALGLEDFERIAGFVFLGTAEAPAIERARKAPLISRF